MGCGKGIVDDMESVATALIRHQVVEAVYGDKSCRVEIRLSPRDALPDREGNRRDRITRRRGEEQRVPPAVRPAPRTRRCVLLRSPAVGIWRRAAGVAAEERGGGRTSRAGTVLTVLGEEEVAVPREGRLLVELAEEASLVGYGAPLALWEVV